jgi:hypothetical protein
VGGGGKRTGGDNVSDVNALVCVCTYMRVYARVNHRSSPDSNGQR